MRYFLILFTLLFVFFSCQNNELQDVELLDPTYGKDYTLISLNDSVKNRNGGDDNTIQIIEVVIDLHRPKPKRCDSCQCGLGVCEINVCVPSCDRNLNSDKLNQNSLVFRIPASLEKGRSNVQYLEMLLENPLGEEFDTNFYVDEGVTDVDSYGNSYTIYQGIYEIDYSMGDNGGYRIPLSID